MKTKQKPALSMTAVSAIAASFCDALDANHNTGSLLHTLCETTIKYTGGEQLADSDITSVTDRVIKARGWKGATLDARKSECKVILRAAHVLPEAMKAFRKHRKNPEHRCQWHDGMALARRLNKGDSVDKAVNTCFKKRGVTGDPMRRLAGALKTAWENVPRKRADIVRCAKILGIEGDWVKA